MSAKPAAVLAAPATKPKPAPTAAPTPPPIAAPAPAPPATAWTAPNATPHFSCLWAMDCCKSND